MLINYVLEVDETYRHNGKRKRYLFEVQDEDKAIEAYENAWRGMVTLSIVEMDDEYNIVKQYLHTDTSGNKYIKGSPYYHFPTVPRIAKAELLQRGKKLK
ncbi:hypothetical protein [Brevibacillus sp. SYSU BS000544]|uniref:hypothetical protein n=1 Tax=Brevibacillus sp. SYSU BS000544 TaxID=3416443 RepID=UPI003CE4DBCE